jgi:cysteinyl-tRNA synthetase
MQIYNYITKKKEQFTPIKEGEVSMYVCGVTPYDHAHIGHIVSALRFNTIRNYLKYKGYKTTFVQNVTDIDDKIIARAKKDATTHTEVSERFTKEYDEALSAFNISPADSKPKVTDYVEGIIKYISELINGGYAYATDKGNVYFDVSKKDDYGKLSNRKVEDMLNDSRGLVADGESDKKSPVDFALWKSEDDTDFSWDSPWGKGRPGWHIECSAMSNDILGSHIDIHGGGLDLNFPHHENELAQCEAHNHSPYVNYWMYSGLVQVDGVKMSKSLGNYITAGDAIEKYTAELISYVVHTFNYRSHINFQEKIFKDNLNAVADVYRLFRDIDKRYGNESVGAGIDSEDFSTVAQKLQEDFENAMDDDFGSAGAIVVLNEAVNLLRSWYDADQENVNKNVVLLKDKIKGLAAVFGLFQRDSAEVLNGLISFHQKDLGQVDVLDLEKIEYVLTEMSKAKLEKDYEKSDAFRKSLEDKGILAVQKAGGSVDWKFSI